MNTRISLAVPSLLLLSAGANAQISFDPAVTLPVGNQPEATAILDVDADGDLDLAITSDAPDKISIFRNDGAGGFALSQTVLLGAGTSPHTPAAADLDGDGDFDLVVTLKNVNQIRVVLNSGGTFAAGNTFATGTEPRDLALADLNGDARPDAITSNRDSDNLSVLINNGSGGFGAAVSLPAGGEPRKVTAADLDGDGDVDIAAASNDTRDLSLFFNSGAGTFGGRVSVSVGANLRPDGIGAADIDGDGDNDLIASTSGNGLNFVSTFTNTAGTFSAPTHVGSGGINPGSLVTGDFDGDGDSDVVVINEDSNNIAALANNGFGGLGAPSLFSTGLAPQQLAAGDLDGDGGLDVVTADQDAGSASIFFNQNGGPAATATIRNGSGANDLCYTNNTLPILGSTMSLTVDASGTPGTTVTFVVGYTAPLTFPTAFGELLVDPTSSLGFTSTAAVVGTSATHFVAVPADVGFAGFNVASQAVLSGGGIKLCNAVDFVLGF